MEALLLRSVLGSRNDRIVVFRERDSKLAPATDTVALLTAVTNAKDDSDDESLWWADPRA
jgi:hypothetical protein